ncbi:MAG: molybdate ABC transporter permease subunit, partial [Sutterella wadsworthensis]|nr:molybdate ABC transporter permease subunit [Sutterella wadsworthensis]
MVEWFLDLVDGISLEPVALSLELAFVTTCILLVLGLPLAWWLARARSRWCSAVNAVVTLPLVL